MLGLSALACNLGLDDNKNIIYVTSTAGPSSSEMNLTFTGPGTDTWSWQQGALTCDTQDEMKLTIMSDNSAKLNSRGLCFFSRQVAQTLAHHMKAIFLVVLFYMARTIQGIKKSLGTPATILVWEMPAGWQRLAAI